MRYTPLNYNEINLKAGTYNPSMVKSFNNKTYAFWERALFQRACSVLDIKVPEYWEGELKDFLYYCLFKFGFIGVTYIDKFGYVFNPCTLKGYNFYYQPTNFLITNPALDDTLDCVIGETGSLLKLTPDYMGVWDIISYYAEKLSVLDNAINLSLINMKFSFILGAKNKNAAEALKKMLDKINKGEPAVIVDMKILNDPNDKEQPFQLLEIFNPKEQYMTTDQLKDFQTILNNFDTEIGIPTIPYQKKERMVESEADSKQADATSRSLIWYNTLKSSIKKMQELYPDIEMDVKMRFNPCTVGGDTDGQNDTDRIL